MLSHGLEQGNSGTDMLCSIWRFSNNNKNYPKEIKNENKHQNRNGNDEDGVCMCMMVNVGS